ncbi:MAG: flagellar biosynthesis protein FlhF, partial [Bdellovibrionales bacterium]|nr:flagellar biosynthesis protein FlhF [Bdellovibrionales bacterium]
PREQLKKKAYVSAWIARYLLDNTQIAENRTLNKYHVFVGPSGHGKTSSLVKLASHMVICEKKSIAIVTTDTQKVGAAEQLKIYSQILNVPFAIIRRKQDWHILDQKLAKVDCILIDSPGMNLRAISELDFLRDILPPETGGRSIHYVQSALARDEAAYDVANRYKVLGFNDIVFTNIDETTHHGIIFNFQKKFETPLHSFGIGSHIPEDFEPATKERVVDLIFKITNFKKYEAINE